MATSTANTYRPAGLKKGVAFKEIFIANSESDLADGLSSAVPGAVINVLAKQVTHDDLTAAAVSESVEFDSAIPAKALILARWIDLDEVFAGGGATAATIDFGLKTTDADGYFDGEDVFTGASLGYKSVPGTLGALVSGGAAEIYATAQTPIITVISDVNVDTLTSGEVWAYVAYVATPVGDTIE